MTLKTVIGERRPVRVGISGSGFVARGLLDLFSRMPERYVVSVLCTRRPVNSLGNIGDDVRLTNDPEELVDQCQLVIECSGKVGAAARVVQAAGIAGRPVLTMNAEFQLTLGGSLSDLTTLYEVQGDQPGSLGALANEARMMGFKPVVFGSQKGFLDRNPSPESMQMWSVKQGISMSAVTSFTDGTKVQIEHALVGNSLGATIADRGLIGPKSDTLVGGALELAGFAERLGCPISDYVLQPGGRGEVFVVATHDAPADILEYYKLGQGPYYVIERPFHLGYLEVPISIERLLTGQGGLLKVGGKVELSVAAIAKRKLLPGHRIGQGIGSFDVRGEAIRVVDFPDHLPIGLLENAVVRKDIEAEQLIGLDDIELSDEVAFGLWQKQFGDTGN